MGDDEACVMSEQIHVKLYMSFLCQNFTSEIAVCDYVHCKEKDPKFRFFE